MGDPQNEALARNHGLAVASIDYRLAPEYPYPAAADDCEAAATWLLSEGIKEFGAERIFIGGESAGAHLALVTANRIRDRLGGLIHGLNLVFGIYDLNGTPSQRDNGGLKDLLDPQGIRMFIEAFTPGMSEEQRRHPDVSPLNADLSDLPPALISVGVNDHFRDDSLFLGARLLADERPVDLAVYPDSPHGFSHLPTKMAATFQKRVDAWWGERLMGNGS
jgi:acetyl esterase/lipase